MYYSLVNLADWYFIGDVITITLGFSIIVFSFTPIIYKNILKFKKK